METVAIISLVCLVLCLGRVVTGAFIESMPAGILCMALPGYVLYFALRRYRFRDRIPVVFLLFASAITFSICVAYAGEWGAPSGEMHE